MEEVLMMIYEEIGFVCDVESMRHPWKQFRWLFLWLEGLFALSNPCVTRLRCFVDDFLVPRGCLRCRIHASPVEAVSLMISEATGSDCVVESMRHPSKQFRWWFLSRQRLSFCGWFLRAHGLIALWNPCVTHGRSFVDDLWCQRGCLHRPIHGSPVEEISLMISEARGAICAVESRRHPW